MTFYSNILKRLKGKQNVSSSAHSEADGSSEFTLRSQTFGLSSCLESTLSDTIVFMTNAYSSMSKQAGDYSLQLIIPLSIMHEVI